MSEIVSTALNSFAKNAEQKDVPYEEPIFVLTASQLQQIISQAIVEAVQPLQDEVSQLKVTVANLESKVSGLEATQDLHAENDLNMLRLINELRQKPEEVSPLLDELYKEMKAIGRKQADFATAARMVKRSKRRISQLKAAIALDQRFILIPSESHSQKILIRLREFYKTA